MIVGLDWKALSTEATVYPERLAAQREDDELALAERAAHEHLQ